MTFAVSQEISRDYEQSIALMPCKAGASGREHYFSFYFYSIFRERNNIFERQVTRTLAFFTGLTSNDYNRMPHEHRTESLPIILTTEHLFPTILYRKLLRDGWSNMVFTILEMRQ